MTLEFNSYTYVYVICISDIFHVHLKWVYTISQLSAVMNFIMDLNIQELFPPSAIFYALFGLIDILLVLLSSYMSYMFRSVL